VLLVTRRTIDALELIRQGSKSRFLMNRPSAYQAAHQLLAPRRTIRVFLQIPLAMRPSPRLRIVAGMHALGKNSYPGGKCRSSAPRLFTMLTMKEARSEYEKLLTMLKDPRIPCASAPSFVSNAVYS